MGPLMLSNAPSGLQTHILFGLLCYVGWLGAFVRSQFEPRESESSHRHDTYAAFNDYLLSTRSYGGE